MAVPDLEMVLAWRNHPDIRRFMLTQHEIEMAEHKQWFRNVVKDPTKHLFIFERNGVPSGFVHFNNAFSQSIASWGFFSAPTAQKRKGNGSRLGLLALMIAFEDLDVHKVSGQVLAYNAASIQLHKKLGFKKEGVLREQQLIGSEYHDLICFGLLRDEWLAQHR